jgi:outer membrane protein assembly factor BamB/chitodextrinase
MIKLGGGEMYKKFVLLVSVSFLLLSVVPGTRLVEREGVSANVGGCGQQVLSGSGKDGNVDWWPMFRHDLRHTGYSTSIAPNTNNTLWSYTTGGDVSSSPAVVDGRVYVGSWDSKVYALNATDGTLVWSYTTGSAVASSPAVFDGRLYIGSYDRKVYALNATTGTLIWSYMTGGVVYSSPALANGTVYVGSDDRKVYALNATNGVLVWRYVTGDFVSSSPAVGDGRVYIGSYDRKVYALNATNGAVIWSYMTGGVVYSSPALADGKVYIGSHDKNVYVLNATTGALVWSYTAGDFVSSSPAVADGKVFVGSWDSNVYCLNATDGTLVWSYATGDIVPCSPGVADSKVYIGSYDSRVYALDATNGMLVWSYRTGDIVPSSPVVVDGRVYMGSCDNKVYAFSTHDVAINNVTPSATVVHIGEVVHVTVVLRNEGTETETFNVTTCYNDISIETQTVINLAPYTETTLIFNWNTTNVSLGNYIISAKAETVSGETDIADNTYINGTIKIIKRPVAVFTYSPAIPLTKEAITFNASLSTPDGGTLISYEWDFGDRTNATGVITTHSYDDNGTYTVTLTITDDEGLSDTDSQDVTVLNRPPVVSLTESASTVFTSEVIYFNASESYDLDGVIVTYFWDFGDGTNATGVTVDRAYEYNGTYTVTLTATDDDGVSASTSADKTVLNRPDIAVTNVASFKAVVGQGYSLKINVNVTNEGDFTETFNVTVYANTTVAATQIVTLSSRNSRTITFLWNTSGFAYGKYTISAYAWPVLGETDTADNTFIGGVVVIVIPGDINCDMWVNAKDAVLLGKAFGSHQGQAEYNPNADINDDDWINAKDAIILGKNFNEHW